MSLHELLKDPIVLAAFDAAWADSFADIPDMRHEEGGWILRDDRDGTVTTRRVPPGSKDSLAFAPPDFPAYLRVLASFHTHPTPRHAGGFREASEDDHELCRAWGIPAFVNSESAIFIVNTDGTHTIGGFR